MPRMKQHPKYNVVSCRVSDETRAAITRTGRRVQEFLHAAIEEKLISDRQAQLDTLVRNRR
jgi:hypothetical protein